jgi:hypothetical protein
MEAIRVPVCAPYSSVTPLILSQPHAQLAQPVLKRWLKACLG